MAFFRALSASILLLLAACGGGGGGGASDADDESRTVPITGASDYFPLLAGSTWTYAAHEELGILGVREFERTTRVTESSTANGRTAATLAHETSDDGETAYEEYLAKDSRGIATLGNSDPEDPYTPIFAPYWEVDFSVPLGGRFVQFERDAMPLGEDYDGDGVEETGDLRSEVALIRVEPITVPAGSFADALYVRRVTTLRIHITSVDAEETLIDTDDRWFARGVGLIKVASELRTASDNALQGRIREELIGYSVGPDSGGRFSPFMIAPDFRSDFSTVGAAAASNGESSLVVYCLQGTSADGLFATAVSASSTATMPARLTSEACDFADTKVASDGESYLVVFNRSHPLNGEEVAGIRVSASGAALGEAFSISTSSGFGSRGGSVVFDGQDYVVLYRDGTSSMLTEDSLAGVRITPAGVVSAPTVLTLGAGAPMPYVREIAFDGTSFLAVGVHSSNPSSFGSNEIYGLRFDEAFQVLGEPFAISTAPWNQSAPELAFDGANYLVAWLDERSGTGPAIYVRRVSPTGGLLDGDAPTGGISIAATGPPTGLDLAFDGTEYVLVGAASAGPDGYQSSIFVRHLTTTAQPVDGAAAGPQHVVARGELQVFSERDQGPVIAGASNHQVLAWARKKPKLNPLDEARTDLWGAVLLSN